MSLTFLIVALVALGRSSVLAVTCAGVGVLAYLGLPAKRPPNGAITYKWLPAVVMPDVLGFLLTAFFVALPVWAARGEPELWDGFPLVHPSALLAWPLALVTSAILVVSARHAAFWMRIEADGLRVCTLRHDRFLPFREIATVNAGRRGLPRWIRWSAPLLAWRSPAVAGAVLLARNSSVISITMKDGQETAFHTDALEHGLKPLLAALRRHGLDPAVDAKTGRDYEKA